MNLPPELRQIIYDYYLEDRNLPTPRKIKSHIDPFDRIEIKPTKILKGYFGLLHHSSGVRTENVVAIYKAWFTGVWILCDIDEHTSDARQRHGGLRRVKEMCSLIREIDKDIVFGLHFVVSDHSRSVFLRFVDSFFGLQAEGEDHLKPEYVCSARRRGEQLLTSSTSDICYTYWTTMRGDHELWMFGSLAKLDWRKFSFEFPTPDVEHNFHWEPPREGSVEVDGEDGFCRIDEEDDTALDSEDEISGLYPDDEDDEHEQEQEQDWVLNPDEGVFSSEDEVSLLDAEVNGYMYEFYGIDGEHDAPFDDEDEREDRGEGSSAADDEAVLLDTEDEGSLSDSEDGGDVLDDGDDDELWEDLGF